MTLYLGPGWMPVTRKQEQDMSTLPVKGLRLDKKSGQFVQTKPAYRTKNKALKTARLAKAWAEKSKVNQKDKP